jgi:tetratricopeptide (TPR) repeat protein
MLKNLIAGLTLLLFVMSQSFAQQGKKPAKPVVLTKDQVSEFKKTASEYFKSENYKAALEIYRQLQANDPNNADYNYKLGVCYLNTEINRKMAAGYLVKAASSKEVPKDVNYHLGRALLILEELDDAIDTYEKFKIANGGKVNPKLNLDNCVEWCYHARDLKKSPVDVKFYNLGKLVNSPNKDYRPVCDLNGSTIYFTSNRKGNTGAIIDGFGEYISDGYFTQKDTGYSKAKNLGPNINGMAYDEVLQVSVNGDRLLLYKEGGDAVSPLYTAELNGKSFDKAAPVAKFPASKIEGACMTTDGKTIYFAADLKGGKGGKDIWMTTLNDKNEWSTPKNLGDGVNTKFDEINPWLFFDEQTLFFASEGHNSMGGFDIFMSSRPNEAMDWSNAVNVGYPLNNTDDNKYFCLTADGKTGFLSMTTVDGVGESDLFKFQCTKPLVTSGRVTCSLTFLKADGTPARDASCMIIKNDTGESKGVYKINSITGQLQVYLQPGTYKFKVKGVKSGRADEDITLTGSEKDQKFNKVIKLSPPVKEGK